MTMESMPINADVGDLMARLRARGEAQGSTGPRKASKNKSAGGRKAGRAA